MKKTYHDVTLKSGHRVVVVRSKFHPVFGYQVVNPGQAWDVLKYTVSKDEMAVSGYADRKEQFKTTVKNFKFCINMAKRKLDIL